jgi:pimeloyl-ACP methyl ester carboxylesterase
MEIRDPRNLGSRRGVTIAPGVQDVYGLGIAVVLGEITSVSDNYRLENVPENHDDITKLDGKQFACVWRDGSQLRQTGYFIRVASEIAKPVRIIHGADDPTPIEGVVDPIKNLIKDLRWYQLQKCGHESWKEQYALGEFWRVVKKEIAE